MNKYEFNDNGHGICPYYLKMDIFVKVLNFNSI